MPQQPTDDQSNLLLDRLAENTKRFSIKRAVAWIAPGPNGGKLDKSMSYTELEQTTNHLASHLLHHANLTKGDRVVLVYPPSLDFMVAFIACLKAGVVAVPVFPPNPLRRDTLTMFSKIVMGCSARVALTNTEYSHAKKLASIKDALKLKKSTAASKADWPDELTWIATDTITNNKVSSSRQSTAGVALERPSRSDLAFLQYTSGSTSEPKGVQISHGNLAHNLRIITNELQAKDHVVVVSWLPQYHDMGLIGSYLGCLYCGGTGYYLSPISFLQRPMFWIEAVSKHRATHLQAPNFAFKLTARKFHAKEYTHDTLNLASIEHVINAAEPVDEESIQVFHDTFGPFGLPNNVIFPTYGLAEHTVFVCSGGNQRLSVDKEMLETQGKVTVLEDDGGTGNDKNNGRAVSRLVGCGYPSKQQVSVKIVDTETLASLPEDMVGEIWVNSPSKAAGYFGMPDETRMDFHARLVASDGDSDEYLRTGDLGFLHNDELFICGRLKDLIIIGGRNYYPQDLEATAEASSELVRPGCSAAFTIDTTHGGGEEVAMVMELKEVQDEAVCRTLASSIRSVINQEHALGLTEIVFLQPKSVPKTSSGKIARSWCRKAFLGGTLKTVYRTSFKSESTTFETEADATTSGAAERIGDNEDAATIIRQMSKAELLSKLTRDLSRMAGVPEDSIDKTANLVSMLDSLTISQFKGLLDAKYHTKLSDEYLFRDTTTPLKLSEVVKLGYAPDDGDGNTSGTPSHVDTGKASGLAGALGCPPGVVCVIL